MKTWKIQPYEGEAVEVTGGKLSFSESSAFVSVKKTAKP